MKETRESSAENLVSVKVSVTTYCSVCWSGWLAPRTRSILIPLRLAHSDMRERCNAYVKVENSGIQARTALILPSYVAHCPSPPNNVPVFTYFPLVRLDLIYPPLPIFPVCASTRFSNREARKSGTASLQIWVSCLIRSSRPSSSLSHVLQPSLLRDVGGEQGYFACFNPSCVLLYQPVDAVAAPPHALLVVTTLRSGSIRRKQQVIPRRYTRKREHIVNTSWLGVNLEDISGNYLKRTYIHTYIHLGRPATHVNFYQIVNWPEGCWKHVPGRLSCELLHVRAYKTSTAPPSSYGTFLAPSPSCLQVGRQSIRMRHGVEASAPKGYDMAPNPCQSA